MEKPIERVKIFLPKSRILTDAEVAALPAEKKTGIQDGIWIEVECPDGSCIDKKGNVHIPAAESTAQPEKGFWFNIFCPADSCEVTQSTDLP